MPRFNHLRSKYPPSPFHTMDIELVNALHAEGREAVIMLQQIHNIVKGKYNAPAKERRVLNTMVLLRDLMKLTEPYLVNEK